MVPKQLCLASGGMEEIMKPKAIEEHNQHMGWVDKSDQLLSYHVTYCQVVETWFI